MEQAAMSTLKGEATRSISFVTKANATTTGTMLLVRVDSSNGKRAERGWKHLCIESQASHHYLTGQIPGICPFKKCDRRRGVSCRSGIHWCPALHGVAGPLVGVIVRWHWLACHCTDGAMIEGHSKGVVIIQTTDTLPRLGTLTATMSCGIAFCLPALASTAEGRGHCLVPVTGDARWEN